jgi:hypothetical protein
MASDPSDATPRGDPARPRFLGLWVAAILFVVLFGGAGGVIADAIYRAILEATSGG